MAVKLGPPDCVVEMSAVNGSVVTTLAATLAGEAAVCQFVCVRSTAVRHSHVTYDTDLCTVALATDTGSLLLRSAHATETCLPFAVRCAASLIVSGLLRARCRLGPPVKYDLGHRCVLAVKARLGARRQGMSRRKPTSPGAMYI